MLACVVFNRISHSVWLSMKLKIRYFIVKVKVTLTQSSVNVCISVLSGICAEINVVHNLWAERHNFA